MTGIQKPGFEALGPEWERINTLGGRPGARKPGFEVHEQATVDEHHGPRYIGIAISSKYRFTAYGDTPLAAIEAVAFEMRDFIKELERHLTHV